MPNKVPLSTVNKMRHGGTLMELIIVLQKWQQEDQKFKAILGYTMSLRQPRLHGTRGWRVAEWLRVLVGGLEKWFITRQAAHKQCNPRSKGS